MSVQKTTTVTHMPTAKTLKAHTRVHVEMAFLGMEKTVQVIKI